MDHNFFAESLKKVRQHLLTGVSYAIPFVACGGIMIALASGVLAHDARRARNLRRARSSS